MSFELLSLRQLLFPKEEHCSLVFKLRCIIITFNFTISFYFSSCGTRQSLSDRYCSPVLRGAPQSGEGFRQGALWSCILP